MDPIKRLKQLSKQMDILRVELNKNKAELDRTLRMIMDSRKAQTGSKNPPNRK